MRVFKMLDSMGYFHCLQQRKMFTARAVKIYMTIVCAKRRLTTFPPQTGVETTEATL